MSWFDVLLVVHLLAVMVWVGGAFTGMLLGMRISGQGDVDAMARFCTAFAAVAGPLFGGASLLVLGTGIWMVADSPIEFSAQWISLGFLGWIVSTVLGATVVGRSWYGIGERLAEPRARLSVELAALARARRWTLLDLAVRVATIVVMVWQPT